MEQKELTYAQKCGKASRRTGLPFEVVLAVSDENANTFLSLYKSVKSRYELDHTIPLSVKKSFKLKDYRDMEVAKECLSGFIIGTYGYPVEGDATDKLQKRIDSLGYKNLKRVTSYFSEIWNGENSDEKTS